MFTVNTYVIYQTLPKYDFFFGNKGNAVLLQYDALL